MIIGVVRNHNFLGKRYMPSLELTLKYRGKSCSVQLTKKSIQSKDTITVYKKKVAYVFNREPE